ncbi:MAG: plastocyanin/azurin family copper-binding protein [Chloroflexota bacterium]
MMMGWQFMGVGGWLWMLAAILLVVGLVVVIASAIGGRSSSSDDDAVAILRARFARGEIDADQFAQVRETLGPSRERPTGWRGLFAGVVILVVGLLVGLLAWASFGGFGGMMGSGMMSMMGPAPTAPAGTSVTLAGSRFTPPTLSIKVGETVRWFNDDAVPHTVTASDRSWDSANFSPGGSFERPCDAVGTYAYVCLYHSWMTGSIVVSGG